MLASIIALESLIFIFIVGAKDHNEWLELASLEIYKFEVFLSFIVYHYCIYTKLLRQKHQLSILVFLPFSAVN